MRPTLKAALGPAAPVRRIATTSEGEDSTSQTNPVPGGNDDGGALPDLPQVGSPMTRMIQQARQTGQVHARSMEQVGQLFSENPDGAITVLRQWINEPTQA